MANKRVTELTAIDGDDVANDDLLMIVDVSDSTMAATGTNKKITVAELVTDSALTGAFWPNSSTALTGSNLANGDKLAVVDVGSPDVAKYITANELVQGSQFSSRYVAKADPIICSSLIGSRNSATSAIGAPTIDTGGSTGCINLPNSASGSESAYFGHVIIPAGWSTATVDFLCQAVDASAGDFRVIGQVATTAATGAGGNAATSVYTKTVTPVADVGGFPVVFTISDAATVAVTPGNYLSPRLRREVQDAADTNTNTLRVIAAVLRKAS